MLCKAPTFGAFLVSLFAFVLYLLIPSAGAATAAKYLVPGGLFVCAVMINKMVSAYHKMV